MSRYQYSAYSLAAKTSPVSIKTHLKTIPKDPRPIIFSNLKSSLVGFSLAYNQYKIDNIISMESKEFQREPNLVTGGNSLAIRVISFRLVDVILDRDNRDVDSRAGLVSCCRDIVDSRDIRDVLEAVEILDIFLAGCVLRGSY